MENITTQWGAYMSKFNISEDAVKLLAKLFPNGIVDSLANYLIKDGQLTTAQWMRCRGIGPKALEKLRGFNLISTPKVTGMEGLSWRLANSLNNAGAATLEDAAKMLKAGTLKPEVTRNYGMKAHAELCKVLGITTFKRCRCDKCGQLLTRKLDNDLEHKADYQ